MNAALTTRQRYNLTGNNLDRGLDSTERYEDSYALTQEPRMDPCIGEHPEMLEDSVRA